MSSTPTGRDQGLRHPHMVMVVGNRVRGDSRVEKAAISAYRAGYEVTVLGLIHRSVPAFDVIDEIPVFRVSPEYSIYKSWRVLQGDLRIERHTEAIEACRRLRRLRDRGRLATNDRWTLHRLMNAVRRRLEDARLTLDRSRLDAQSLLTKLPVRGIWRRAWPLIADLELAFGEAIVDLQPDIVHVHDRHALPAADLASGILRKAGRDMRWIYDAHEWLPGVVFNGPKVHGSAWLAAEAELIGRADAVITVSHELAEKLEKRHKLPVRPAVVTNSPTMDSIDQLAPRRATIREECGLNPDTPLLAYVGRIAERRGLDTVVRALPSLPEVHLAAVAPNDAKPRQELMQVAGAMNVADRVHILDYVPPGSVAWYISSASAGVSPLKPNPAHHVAVATKIREYLHARLPIIGSDVRSQKRFITESGIGAVHRADDPEDCSRAIHEVLTNRESFIAAITPDLLAEHSWERQEEVLRSVWSGVLGVDNPKPHTPRPSPHLVVGPVVEEGRSRSLLNAVCAQTNGTGLLLTTKALADSSQTRILVSTNGRVGDKLDEYRQIVAKSDGLILESLQPLFGNLLKTPEAQLEHLVSIRPVAMMLDLIVGVHPEELIERVPDFWFLALDETSRARISRQGGRTRRLISAAGTPVLATTAFPYPELDSVSWLPTVVQVEDEPSFHTGSLRILVAPGPRAGRDAVVPEMVAKLNGSGVEVQMPATSSDAKELLPEVDVLVDSLGLGSYSDLAAQAMGLGCVILSRIGPEAESNLPAPCPVLNVTPSEVVDTLSALVSDRDWCNSLMKEAVVYARNVHGGRRSAAIVSEVMGWSLPS